VHITFRQLEIFETVARHSSVTRAAEELHLTQPAVSMQIKQLESAIGLPLFEQVGRRKFLTDAGRTMQHYSRSMTQQLAEAVGVLEELKGIEGGHFKISVATTVNYYATRLLADFCREHPGVRINLDVTNREALLRQLELNETDIVLMGQPPESLDVIAEPFKDNPLVVIAPPDHRFARRRKPVSLSELEAETFITREEGSGTRLAMERSFEEYGISPSSRIELNSNEAVKQGVQAGLGLGFVSAHTLELELETDRLKILKAEGFPIVRRWYVVHRCGKRLSVAALAFKDSVLKKK
jgi:DNA-binding transcriptional LysR family regulator